MTFPRIRAAGMWTLGSVLSPSEEEAFDDHQSKAIDGYAGGAYAPSAPIVVGASGGNTTGIHVTAILQADQLNATVASGQEILFLTGSGAIFNATANISMRDGSAIFLSTDGGLGGAALHAGGPSTFDGILGARAEVTFGPHSDTTLNTGATVTDAAAHTVTGAWALNTGAHFTFNAGTFLQVIGGTTTIDSTSAVGFDFGATASVVFESGATLQVKNTLQRIGGADVPSGAGAYRGLRCAVGPLTSSTIVAEAQEVLEIPGALAANIVYTLATPAVPVRLTVVCPVNITGSLTFKQGASDIMDGGGHTVGFAGGVTAPKTITLVYAGVSGVWYCESQD